MRERCAVSLSVSSAQVRRCNHRYCCYFRCFILEWQSISASSSSLVVAHTHTYVNTLTHTSTHRVDNNEGTILKCIRDVNLSLVWASIQDAWNNNCLGMNSEIPSVIYEWRGLADGVRSTEWKLNLQCSSTMHRCFSMACPPFLASPSQTPPQANTERVKPQDFISFTH